MRFSLSNRFFAVSYREFQNYCADFQVAVGYVAATPFKAVAAGYSIPKEYTTIYDDSLNDACESINAQARQFEGILPSDITEEMWRDAKYVDVLIKPLDEEAAPRSAFAHMEFKGHLDRTATFYVQPDDALAGVKELMLGRYPDKIAGDGYADHSNSNSFIKAGLQANPLAVLTRPFKL
ncbi:MAG: hypothetical protein WC989_01370 [Micavibrio sp.]